MHARWLAVIVTTTLFTAVLRGPSPRLHAESPAPAEIHHAPHTVDEARIRARLLHETIHGVLQVVHRDFFDEDDVHMLPSQSLEDVFSELERSHGVSIRWISVNTKAMNVDHEPRGKFEKNAVKALSAGKGLYDAYEPGKVDALGTYRHVGAIRLASQCLKCHVPNRTSTEDRIAGLSISMRIAD